MIWEEEVDFWADLNQVHAAQVFHPALHVEVDVLLMEMFTENDSEVADLARSVSDFQCTRD